MKISAVIAAYNEEKNIKRCLDSLSFASEIIVIDSMSTDKTVKICRAAGAKVYSVKFKSFSQVKGLGLKKAKGDYIFVIDADEAASAMLAAKLGEIAAKGGPADAYEIKRENFFLGRVIRHCGWGKDYQIRFFKNGKARYDGKIVHENLIVRGVKGRIQEPILHYTYPDSASYFEKVNRYTSLQAVQDINKMAFLKMLYAPFFRFFRMYFLKLGFLDGFRGFILCVYSGFTDFIRFAKAVELKRLRK